MDRTRLSVISCTLIFVLLCILTTVYILNYNVTIDSLNTQAHHRNQTLSEYITVIIHQPWPWFWEIRVANIRTIAAQYVVLHKSSFDADTIIQAQIWLSTRER